MAVNSNRFKSYSSTADTTRGPSAGIWGDCPVAAILEDPSLGMYFFDDFLMAGQIPVATGGTSVTNMGQWGLFCAQGGLLTDGASEGGSISLASDGDQEAVNLASLAGAFRLVTTSTNALNGKLWFECRFSVSTISSTKMDIFVGLADKLVTSNLLVNGSVISTTDDTLSTAPNLIGFHKKSGGPTEVNFVYQLAAGTAVYPTSLTTLMNSCTGAVNTASAFHKFGFVFDPNAPLTRIGTASTGQTAGALKQALIRVSVDNMVAPAFLTSDNTAGSAFPTGFMGPVIAVMQTATGANAITIDWIRCAQLANS